MSRIAAMVALLAAVCAALSPQLWAKAPTRPASAALADDSAARRNAPIPPELLEKLAALSPSEPEQYFRLGEELADVPSDRARAEARRLFILTADIATGRSDAKLTRSAYLALASLAQSAEEKRWILAVMQAESPQLGQASPGTSSGGKMVIARDRAAAASRARAEDASYELALALGRYRAGDFRRSKESLRRVTDPQSRLVAAGMEPERAQAILRQVTSETDGVGSCPRCHNERIIRTIVDGKPVVEPCPLCFANPGPTPPLPAEAYLEEVRAEALLLDVAPRSWGDESLLDSGRPLRDVSLEALCAEYQVDTQKTLWHGGMWVMPSAGP